MRMMTSDLFPFSPSPSPSEACSCARSLESPPSLTASGAVSKSDSGDDALVPFTLLPPFGGLGLLAMTDTACLTLFGLVCLRLLLDFEGEVLAGTFFSSDLEVVAAVSPPTPCFFRSWRLSKMAVADLDNEEELATLEEGGGGEGGDVLVGFLAPERVERKARRVEIRGESRPLIGSFCSWPALFDDDAMMTSSSRCIGGGGGALGWEDGVKKLSRVSMGGREG